MFERMTDRGRRTIVLAQEEAKGLNHSYIGTEHLLLGLLHEGQGVAAQALGSLGVMLDAVRDQVVENVGRGQVQPQGHIPFTPRSKKVLELSLREALQLGHNYVGTEHILLGLIREGKGVAMTIIGNLGVDPTEMRKAVLGLLVNVPTAEVVTETVVPTRKPDVMKSILAELAGIRQALERLAPPAP
jgi:ATP-dependent Clp protease ATP-binding subunit ClpC